MTRFLLVTPVLLLGLFMAAPAAAQVPGLEFLDLAPDAEIGDILVQLYVFGVAIASLAAFVMLVIGGVQYMIAGDRDPSAAKQRIQNALWGLVLALGSWLILYVINKEQLLQVTKITPIGIIGLPPPGAPAVTGFCRTTSGASGCASMSSADCEKAGGVLYPTKDACVQGEGPAAPTCPPPGTILCRKPGQIACTVSASAQECQSAGGAVCKPTGTCP